VWAGGFFSFAYTGCLDDCHGLMGEGVFLLSAFAFIYLLYYIQLCGSYILIGLVIRCLLL